MERICLPTFTSCGLLEVIQAFIIKNRWLSRYEYLSTSKPRLESVSLPCMLIHMSWLCGEMVWCNYSVFVFASECYWFWRRSENSDCFVQTRIVNKVVTFSIKAALGKWLISVHISFVTTTHHQPIPSTNNLCVIRLSSTLLFKFDFLCAWTENPRDIIESLVSISYLQITVPRNLNVR